MLVYIREAAACGQVDAQRLGLSALLVLAKLRGSLVAVPHITMYYSDVDFSLRFTF